MTLDASSDRADSPTTIQPDPRPAVRAAWSRWIEPLAAAALFGAALWVLGRELRTVDPLDITRAAEALPSWRIWVAVAATVLNYAVLTGYDHLAIRQLKRKLSAWQVSVAAFVAFAVVNNVGFALISGPWARYRFYVRWGVDLSALPQVVAFNAITLWTGLFSLLGAVLVIDPDPALAAWAPLGVWRLSGAMMLTIVVAYVLVAAAMKRPFRVWRWDIQLPDWPMALGQVLVSVADWCLIAAVLWLLLPDGTVGFAPLLAAFLVAQLLGLASHVPGGLGVFEGTMLTLLHGKAPAHSLLAGLLLFRIVYYLLPLVVAVLILVADTAARGTRAAARLGSGLGELEGPLLPRILALATFAAGTTLLIAGALPAHGTHQSMLHAVVPGALRHAAQVAGSVIGTALLLLAQGVLRRLAAAWRLTMALVSAGIASALLTGWDPRAALVLTAVLVAVGLSGRRFERASPLLESPFAPGWTVAAVAAVGGSIWLGWLVHRHLVDPGDPWWHLARNHDAARALHAAVGAALVLVVTGVVRFVGPKRWASDRNIKQ